MNLNAARCAQIFIASVFFACTSAFADWKPVVVPSSEDAPAPAASAGEVWFRCFIRVPDNMAVPAEKDLWRDSITLSLGGIRGPFAVWLNGQKIAEGASIAVDQRQRFKVPKNILEKKVFNVLAVQLQGGAVGGGLGMAPILAGYHDELPLEGRWEMREGKANLEELHAVSETPVSAVFTEAGFHPASTALSANSEPMPGARLDPAEALAKMQTPDDLAVDLILSEPLVAQPTHISFDEWGRMWVAQYRQYPYPAGLKMLSRDKYYRAHFDRVPPAPPNQDRGKDIISLHEDTKGNGVFDRHRVVLAGLNMANAALYGHGGLWVMNTPYLLFYPKTDPDGLPHGDPVVRLGGFGLEDAHSVANGLTWGPDGWLYGAQGSTTSSHVVRPGVDAPGFPGVYHEGCMIWRYHPKTKVYEIFAEGGGNIFGLDFDSEGRLYSGHNGGETRGWHYLQSGLFLKQGVDPGKFGPVPNPYAFGHLEQMKSRNPIPRFSHATIVAEGTSLPGQYAGRFFAADPLHRKIFVAERYHRGSTFETSDSGAALEGADPSFRPVYLTNAPDGAIYVADFYEEFIAHGQHYQGQIDPSTGRIYRIRGKGMPLENDTNLAAKTNAQLVELLRHPNRWHRQTAVRLLGERRDPATIEALRGCLREAGEHPALEALWSLHQMEALDESTALLALKHSEAAVRAWAVRLRGDAGNLPEEFRAAVMRLAESEPDAEVRNQMASTACRLPAAQALPLAAALLHRAEDMADPCIPLLCWWAIERHCGAERDAVVAAVPWDAALTLEHLLPRVMRRFAAAGGRGNLLACARLLSLAPSAEDRQALMTGFEQAFKGRAMPPLPDELTQAVVRTGLASRHLRVRLREPEAIREALKAAADPGAKMEERLLCVQLLGEVKVSEAVPVLLGIACSAVEVELRKTALTALLLYDAPAIGEEVAGAYSKLPPEVKSAAQTLLTSRPAWSLAFLQRIAAGEVSAAGIPPAIAALLKQHPDVPVADLARKVFGESAPSLRPEHRSEIERLRRVIGSGSGDPYKGEATFTQRCSVCHTLFHKGGRIGPDLTAYQREDLGTLLPSIVDPSAEVREGYVNHIVTTTDGRTLSGFVVDQDPSILVLRGLDGQDVSIPRAEVRESRASAQSIMPEGLLTGLSDQELRDFFAYLRLSQPITR